MSLRPGQGHTHQAPSAWNATLDRRTRRPAPAFWAGTPRRPSAAAPRAPAGEMPVTCAQMRTQVRPPRVPGPLRVGSAGRHRTKWGGGAVCRVSLSELGCLPAQSSSARSALVGKATSLWKEPGCLDRPRTQVTSPRPSSPNATNLSGPGLVPQEASACRLHLLGCF